ncbi:MAG TPA: cation:proton antiporter [Longimicrobiales bacterium]|nr:cation:proton antiporter [Longimicrobiales bacterium]
MHGVAALLAAAALAYALARALRAPAIPLLLVAGLVLSRVGLMDAEALGNALVLGVSFLLFVVGMELDPRRIRAQRAIALRVGVFQFLLLALLGYVIAALLGFGFVEASYIALAMTASSTLVCVRLLQRRGQMFEPFGRLVLGVLLLQDALVLLSIPLVTELGQGVDHALISLGSITLLALAALAVRRWITPLLLRIANDQELLLLTALSMLFAFIMFASILDLPIVVGAFLSGVALSRFPVDGIVRADFAPIGDFFTAIFFTALGALVGIPGRTELVQALVLALVVIVVTPPLVALLATRAGFATKSAVEAGLLLAQTSEISLVIGLAGMFADLIAPETFTVIALVTLTTMLLTPLIANARVASVFAHLLVRPHRFTGAVPSGHVLLLGTGSTGMPLLEDLVLGGSDIVVVDDDPAVVRRLLAAGIRTVLGDASDEHVLRHAGADRALVVNSTIRRARDNDTLLQVAKGVPVLVRVFDAGDAVWVREHGGIPVVYSEASADNLMEWFEDQREELAQNLAARLRREA